MRDFVVLHHTHTFIMWRRPVITQVIHYLKNGKFRSEPDKSQKR